MAENQQLWWQQQDDTTCFCYGLTEAVTRSQFWQTITQPFHWCGACLSCAEAWLPCDIRLNYRCRVSEWWRNFIRTNFPEGAQERTVGTLSIFFTTFGSSILCLPWCAAQMGILTYIACVGFTASAASSSLDVFIDGIADIEMQNCLLQEVLRESLGNVAASLVIALTLVECLVNLVASYVFAIDATTPLILHNFEISHSFRHCFQNATCIK